MSISTLDDNNKNRIRLINQIIPNVVATVAICQNVNRSRGFNSNIRTLLTPPHDHPYIFNENKNRNTHINNVGLNKLLRLHPVN